MIFDYECIEALFSLTPSLSPFPLSLSLSLPLSSLSSSPSSSPSPPPSPSLSLLLTGSRFFSFKKKKKPPAKERKDLRKCEKREEGMQKALECIREKALRNNGRRRDDEKEKAVRKMMRKEGQMMVKKKMGMVKTVMPFEDDELVVMSKPGHCRTLPSWLFCAPITGTHRSGEGTHLNSKSANQQTETSAHQGDHFLSLSLPLFLSLSLPSPVQPIQTCPLSDTPPLILAILNVKEIKFPLFIPFLELFLFVSFATKRQRSLNEEGAGGERKRRTRSGCPFAQKGERGGRGVGGREVGV